MPATVSHGLHDCSHLQLVSVIASFDVDGNMRPLYVRIGEASYKIHSCRLNPHNSFQKTFRCRIEDNGISKPLELTYHFQENMWTIPAQHHK